MLSDALLVHCSECGFITTEDEYNFCPSCEDDGVLDVELKEF